uniref:G-protein coupled receptors family 1 profile domain-containing protein n=1 Tax=Lates calcarifer TaxID=8187 RepID=A0A4W6BW51_LATCA
MSFCLLLIKASTNMSDLVSLRLNSSFNTSFIINQTPDNSTDCAQVDTSAQLLFIPIYSLVFLVGLLLNSFTMKFYFCRGQQRSSSSMMVYLKNLAAADFLFCLCLPLRIAKYSNCSITIHQIFCSFGASAFYLNMYASILFMGYIAANRYLKIVHPSQTHILHSVQSAHIISTVTWFFLLVIMIAYIILSHLTQPQLTSVSNKCEVLLSAQVIMFFKIIHICSTTVFLFVLISLVFFYYNSSCRVLLAQ